MLFSCVKLDDDVKIDVEEEEEEEELVDEDVAEDEEGEEMPMDLSRSAVSFFYLNLRNTTKLKGKGIVFHAYLPFSGGLIFLFFFQSIVSRAIEEVGEQLVERLEGAGVGASDWAVPLPRLASSASAASLGGLAVLLLGKVS